MKTQRVTKITALGVAMCVAGALIIAPSAKATLTFTLDNGNTALSGLPTPFGTVAVTLDTATTATVTLTANSAYSYSFGDGSTLALNLATGATLSGLSLTSAGHGGTPSYTGSTSSGTVDGWGYYNFIVDLNDGYHSSVTGLTFTLTKTSGTWASEADILAANNAGAEVAGHVFNSDGSITGYATTGGIIPVPMPAVPEAGTVFAGALLLLPFSASMLRILRKQRV